MPSRRPGTLTETARPFRRRIMVNSLFTGATSVWNLLIGIASLPLMLHGLGATAYGLWVVLFTFSGSSGWFSLLDAGLGVATTRGIAAGVATGDRSRSRDVLGTGLAMVTGLAVVCGPLFALIAPGVLVGLMAVPPHLREPFEVTTRIFGAELVADLMFGQLTSSIEGFNRVDHSRLVDSLRRTGVTAGTAIAAIVSHDLVMVGVASLLATTLAAVTAGAMVRHDAAGTAPRFRRALVPALLRHAWTVGLLRPLGVLHRSIDRFVVGIVIGPAAVPAVEIATQIAAGCETVMAAGSYSVLPGAAELHATGDHEALRKLLLVGTRFVVLTTWMVTVGAMCLARPAIVVWVGVLAGGSRAGVAGAPLHAVERTDPSRV